MTDATALHRDSLVIDGLNASWLLEDDVILRLRTGGVNAVQSTVAAIHDPGWTIKTIAAVYRQIEKHGDIATLAGSAAEIEQAQLDHRTAIMIGFQDTTPIGDNLDLIPVYHRLGVRCVQLTYNNRNPVGCGCMEQEDTGLTGFGREMVRELNRHSMLIDLSHCGERTAREALELSKQPVAVTHSNPASFCPHPRNKSDELLSDVAAGGGVIGAVAVRSMISDAPRVTLEDYVDVIEHLISVVGEDHAGLGPDHMEAMPPDILEMVSKTLPEEARAAFAAGMTVEGFETGAEFPAVTAGLVRRGLAVDTIKGLLGGNWLRLYRRIFD